MKTLSKTVGLNNFFIHYDGDNLFSLKEQENGMNDILLFKSSELDKEVI